MKKKKIVLLVVIVVALAALFYYVGINEAPREALNQEQDLNDKEEKPIEQPIEQESEEEDTSSEETTFPDLGDFKIVYGQTQDQRYQEMNQLIKNSGVFERMADALNAILILPQDFPIVFEQCGYVNAYYTSDEKKVVICDELIENFAQNFVYFVSSEEELDIAVTDATYFILYHELGHGLIDIYDLLYSGREEDVVDQLSTVILVSFSEEGARAAITGANYFYLTSSQIGEGYPFWDEHALNQQRYYNILCWVYGSDPQKYSDFVGVYGLPEERAVWCEREYQKMSDFWDVTIYPYLTEEIKEMLEQEYE